MLVALVAAGAGACLTHAWTKPDAMSLVLSRWRWSFSEAFARLLPTLMAMTFVYWLGVLPYIRSRTRRSALLLTMFAGACLSAGVYAVLVMLVFLGDPGEVVQAWGDFMRRLRWDPALIYELAWVRILGISCVVAFVFVIAAALIPRRPGADREGSDSGSGWHALVGLLVISLLSLPLWVLVGRDLQRGHDRARCIMHIRNVQQAIRSYQNMNGFAPAEAHPVTKDTIIGPDNFLELEPVCPSGGSYQWVERRFPHVGELMVQCSCPDHRPLNHRDW